MSDDRCVHGVTLMLSVVMTRLLMLVPLTVLALAATAEAQSQAGGLPDVSERVQVLETQSRTLQTKFQTLETEAKTLQTRVNTLVSENTALKAAIAEEAIKRAAEDAKAQEAIAEEAIKRAAEAAKAQAAIAEEAIKRAAEDAKAQEAIAQEAIKRAAEAAKAQEAIAQEAQARLTADNDLRAKLDVFGAAGIFSAQFEIVGAGGQATNEFVRVLSELVGPGSWIAVATISNLRGDVLAGRPASRACELRNAAGGFIAGTAASSHDADGVALVVTGGVLAESAGEEIVLWCRVTNSEASGALWDGAQMVTLKIGGFRED